MTIREKKRQKRIITSLVLILVVLIIIFIYFLIKKLDINDKFQVGNKNITYEEISEDDIKDIVLNELDILDGKDNISDINNQEKLLYVIRHYLNDGTMNISSSEEEINEIDANELKDYFSNTSIGYLGFDNENIIDNEKNILVKYDKDSNKYIITDNYKNYDTNIKKVYSKEIDFNNDGKKYTIKYIFLFGNIDGDYVNIYANYDDALNNIDSIGRMENNDSFDKNMNNFYNENYKLIKEKLDSVSYTFEKVGKEIKLIDYKK